MQHFRSSLTRLKSQLEQKLPNGPDIFGYSGISKAMLVNAVDVAYAISQDIQEHDDDTRFEVIALKRYGSEAYQFLRDYLDSDLEKKKSKESFNDFLNCLSNLLERTKLAYFIVAKNGIRDDAELAAIRSQTATLQTRASELAEMSASLEASVSGIKADLETVTTARDTASLSVAEIKTWHTTAEEKVAEMTTSHEAIAGWDEDIQERDTEIRALNQQISTLATEAKQLKDSLASQVKQGESSSDALRKFEEQNKNLQLEIRETLGDANRVGMAASFKERKDELQKLETRWQLIFIIAIVLISGAAFGLVLPDVMQSGRDWQLILSKIAVTSPLVWLGWFAAKQYSYVARIREDYAFKYASSMAYEGHKKATRDVDEALERVLLEFSLYNMSQNPIRLYLKKSDHATPLHDLTETILGKLPDLKKIAYEAPGLGRFVADVKPRPTRNGEDEDS
jgi:predicted RNase H-like nuclease (RuvC/YqgF family)